MIDLTNPDLYEAKRKEMEDFLKLVLVTKTERNMRLDEEDEENSSELTDDQILEYVSLGGGLDEVLSEVKETKEVWIEEKKDDGLIPILEKEIGKPYEKNDFWRNIGVAPYYLFYYVMRSMVYRLGERENVIRFLKMIWKVSGIIGLITGLLIMLTDAKFLFSLNIQLVVSLVLFIGSLSILGLIHKPKWLENWREEMEILDEREEVEEKEEEEDLESEIGEGESLWENWIDDEVGEEVEEEVVEVEKKEQTSPIPMSPIDVRKSMNEFLEDLRKVFEKNEIYRGKEIPRRKDLVLSLSDYLISNDKQFGVWYEIEERSVLYNNIMFTLYMVLCNINNRFKNMKDEMTKMYVNLAKENPLMYKVEIELPDYFNETMLKSKISEFENALKVSEADLEVMVMISKYQQGYVFKIFKPVRGLISLGDILRYHNDSELGKQAYELFMGDDMGLPIVIGLRGNEHPTVIDLAENTSGVIVGESGSGKSWGTFLLMLNLVLSNSYNDLNVVIMDRKKAVFWREFARMPHVVGYHTNVADYFDILKELKEEMEYRKMILAKLGKENWKGLRKSLIKAEKFEELKAFPWLVIVIDEMTNTMAEVREMAGEKNKHIYDSFRDDLATLAQEGRSLGMKLLLIGQRAITDSIPKNNLANSSLKLFFKLPQSDYELGFSDLKNVVLPKGIGQALLQDYVITNPVLLRTLGVGGVDDDQIANIIRILAFEWTRRSLGNNLMKSPRLNFTYNRDAIRERVIEDLERGKLFLSGEDHDEQLIEIVQLLKEGRDISNFGDNDLVPRKIEKEDSLGNVIEVRGEEDSESIKIKMREEEGIRISLQKEEKGHIREENEESLEDLFSNEEDIEEEDEDLEEKSELFDEEKAEKKEVPKKIVYQQWRKNTKVQKIDREKAIERLKKVKEEVKKGNVVREHEKKLPIAYYIQMYGEGGNIKKMKKEEVEKIYTKSEIKKALDSLQIVENGEYYQS